MSADSHAQRPAGAAQRGIWLAHQLDPDGTLYNCGVRLPLAGRVDIPLLRSAVRQALTEAETLRSRFVEHDGRPHRLPTDVPDEPLHVVDLRAPGTAAPHAAADAWIERALATPMDLGRGPLAEHTLLRLGDDSHCLFLRYHHIVLDGYGQTLHLRRLA
ncbi:MAG: condensation domain-containing protein, partial [Streptomyces sp.]|nr:condensation domain-containing protein [Streptomyces sp.]